MTAVCYNVVRIVGREEALASPLGWGHSRAGPKGVWPLCRCYEGPGVLHLDLRIPACDSTTFTARLVKG